MTRVGAQYLGNNRCEFRAWAPLRRQVALRILLLRARDLSLDRDDLGYWQTTIDDVAPGSRYRYLLDGTTQRSDPASQFQPESIHGPSEIVDHGGFLWSDAGWEGVPLEDMVIYELHVGAFTPQGTFEAVIPRLAELRDLGITAIELMPVAQFPGDRNWGYDGVFPFAVQNTYGGPNGLKTLVNAIHRHGMSAILDVVYNHMGPEGNYLRDFGPYFTRRYRTPWGDAVNCDEAYSYGVRNFIIENALFWLREYHFDALRMDALHMIYDQGAKHILQELTEAVASFSRESAPKRYLIGEGDLDDVRFIKPVRAGRKSEFETFHWEQECPNPQAVQAFQESRIEWEKRDQDRHRLMLEFHKRLLMLRRGIPHIVGRKNFTVDCIAKQQVLIWHRRHDWGQVHCLMNFSTEVQPIRPAVQRIAWTKILDSADTKWAGPGGMLPEIVRDRQEIPMPARSLAVFQAGASVTAPEQAQAEAVVLATTGETFDENPGSDL